MNKLLIRQPINENVPINDFLEDIDCLFDVLKASYGLYDYFGEEQFLAAKSAIIQKIMSVPFEFEKAVSIVKDVFSSFIQDGHFQIGSSSKSDNAPGYAVRDTVFHGIDMLQCRKFWFDTPTEEKELLEFSRSFVRYQNEAPLIIDLRDNSGGSDVYVWDFITGLFGKEPDYPYKFVQNYSELFCAYANLNKHGVKSEESDGVCIKNRKPIYILINENTASSAESAVAYFKTIENSVIVGTHTSGCFTCGNCMTAYLPHSHIPIYFGTGMILYEKTRNIDAEGGFRADMSYDDFLKILK